MKIQPLLFWDPLNILNKKLFKWQRARRFPKLYKYNLWITLQFVFWGTQACHSMSRSVGKCTCSKGYNLKNHISSAIHTISGFRPTHSCTVPQIKHPVECHSLFCLRDAPLFHYCERINPYWKLPVIGKEVSITLKGS